MHCIVFLMFEAKTAHMNFFHYQNWESIIIIWIWILLSAGNSKINHYFNDSLQLLSFALAKQSLPSTILSPGKFSIKVTNSGKKLEKLNRFGACYKSCSFSLLIVIFDRRKIAALHFLHCLQEPVFLRSEYDWSGASSLAHLSVNIKISLSWIIV